MFVIFTQARTGDEEGTEDEKEDDEKKQEAEGETSPAEVKESGEEEREENDEEGPAAKKRKVEADAVPTVVTRPPMDMAEVFEEGNAYEIELEVMFVIPFWSVSLHEFRGGGGGDCVCGVYMHSYSMCIL